MEPNKLNLVGIFPWLGNSLGQGATGLEVVWMGRYGKMVTVWLIRVYCTVTMLSIQNFPRWYDWWVESKQLWSYSSLLKSQYWSWSCSSALVVLLLHALIVPSLHNVNWRGGNRETLRSTTVDVMDASEVEGWRGAAWLVMHQASSSSGKHPKSFSTSGLRLRREKGEGVLK